MASNSTKTLHFGRFPALRPMRALPLIILLLAGVSIPAAAWPAEPAAATPPGGGMNQDRDQDADFRFGSPRGFAGFRIGRFFPYADSDLFDMITDSLTLEKSDFRSWDIGFDAGANLHPNVDLIFSFDYLRRSKDSEFRDYVDQDDLPITQTTRYQQTPLTGGVKFLLVPRGRQVGRYAWIPAAVVPYIGAGAGVLWYRLEQEGDFVDEATLEIFPAHLKSSGWTPTAYAGGGADIHAFRNAFVTLDLRYVWARPDLGRDFVSFDTLDLSGMRVSAGLQWHF